MTLTIEKPVQGTPIGLTFYNGVVTSTDQGGPAEKAGLKVDDRLFSVNGTPVQDLATGEVRKLVEGAVGSIDVVVERMQDVEQSRADSCIDVAWDSTQKILAVALRDGGVTIFANRRGQPLATLLEPVSHLTTSSGGLQRYATVQRWSASGQLVIGMTDGTFCIWDYYTRKTYWTPHGGSGQHLSAIKAAEWTLSLVAPALALGSVSTIKVSLRRTHTPAKPAPHRSSTRACTGEPRVKKR